MKLAFSTSSVQDELENRKKMKAGSLGKKLCIQEPSIR